MTSAHDMERLIGEVRDIAERSAGFGSQLIGETVEASSPGDHVTVRANGFGMVTEIVLGPRAHRIMDNITLGEVIRDTISAAEDAGKQRMQQLLDSFTIGGKSVRVLAESGPDLSEINTLIARLGER